MGIIIVILPLSLFLAFVGLCGYFWCVRNGQYDDVEGPAIRAIIDDDDVDDDLSEREKFQG